ncbi:MAG: transglutaminase-like domain-containing protein [Oscillospiraceae bacterium]|nr:transglutaminase-like domain-containing protein [Oscillospiraceae bacterium]
MDTQAEINLLVDTRAEHKREMSSSAKRVLVCCGSGVLIMLAVYCTLGAVVSAFSLPIEAATLFLVCFISAAAVAVFTALYRGKGLLVLIVPVFLLFLLSVSEVIEGGKWVVHEISYQYSRWLPVSALFTDTVEPSADTTAFLSAAGVLLSLLLGFSICLRRSVFTTIAITAPIVFLTFIITSLRSDVIYLLGLISVYLTLLISGTVKPDSFLKRGLIIIPSFIIAIVFMLIAYFFAPQGQYAREEQIAALGRRFRVIASQMGSFGQYWQTYGVGTWDIGWIGRLDSGLWQFNTSDVRIADAGERSLTHQSLLEISSDSAGTFYLRGYSMQSFNGRSWSNRETIPDELDIVARRMPANISYIYSIINENNRYPARAQMAISRTGDITPRIVYEPYFSANHIDSDRFSDTQITGHRFFHVSNSVHSFAERVNREYIHYPDLFDMYPIDALHAYANVLSLLGVYTEIDSNTARELRQIAIGAGIDPNAERTVIADAVARYIRSSGRYTLTPGIIPENEDFALYFLREMREGYCIHFATAAVLMLRSLNIPARFTSGYIVTVAPDEVGQTIELTDLNAHAWVEVFYDDIGWLYLEATPPGGGLYIPFSRPHTPANNVEQEMPDTIPESNVPDNLPDEQPIEDSTDGQISDTNININSDTSTNGITQEEEQSIFAKISRIVITIICILLMAIAIVTRRRIMHRTREKHFKQVNTNKAIICMWRYIKKLGRNEIIIPNDIEELALKARFSQHRMTEEERAVIESYTNRLAYEINSTKGEYGRLWLKYVRALC